MSNQHQLLSRGQIIDGKYTIAFFLKKGSYAESYRVTDRKKQAKFLKLFALSKLHRTQFDSNGDVLEIEILKKLKHPNLVKYEGSGSLIADNQKYAYVILDFISGETLAERMKREHVLNPYEAKEIMLGVLNGLNYLHSKKDKVIHNDITNLNVMLDLSGQVPVPKIIDFGYARYQSQTNKEFHKEGLNPFYTANEAFNKVFSVQTDIFSAGALYFHLLVGLPPWFIELSQYRSDTVDLEDALLRERKKPLQVPGTESRIEESTFNIIAKALQPDAEYRFKRVKDFILAISGEAEVESQVSGNKAKFVQTARPLKAGEGFAAIAGMQKLKDLMQRDVIDAIKDKEKYAEFGLTIPNGMLLYGPPRCGKTFFAEKFAEEVGYKFFNIKPSDIQSKWVNATQENIKNLFDEARKNAPSIIFIDELDALIPNRENPGVNHMNTSAVNEFLAQMNNCGADGVFVIGATNLPSSIDPAVLGTGRLDRKIYVPVPDFEARVSLFKMYLNNRPIEVGFDYQKLAELTEDYASKDIQFICDEAARQVVKVAPRISMHNLLLAIEETTPSLTKEQLMKYRKERDKMDSRKSSSARKSKIGF
ncbi:MAG: AAA family ATPase [Candidatus Cyclonatronum sp.]|uniref:AAA family ATPase n=1 Tax=Cyclonatronum sp. TaxID=3024185 RepID=UPI0025C1B0C7|nr:AAA family ATPase [Cyclonatronum sp.]MCH8487777.1 AAA family ATPase [Cyclonatronum sp.]